MRRASHHAALVIIRRRKGHIFIRVDTESMITIGIFRLAEFFHRRNQGFTVERRQHHSIHFLHDEILDDLNLPLAIGFTFRPVTINFIAQLLARRFRARADRLPINMRGALGNHRDGTFYRSVLRRFFRCFFSTTGNEQARGE